MPEKTLKQVMDEHSGALMDTPGVVSVGQSRCDGQPCIKVYAAKRTPEVDRIPERLDGYPVSIEVSGEFKARD